MNARLDAKLLIISHMRIHHDRLSKAPLVEAVFQLRCTVKNAFSFIPGGLAKELVEFPNIVETDLARIAGMIGIPPSEGLAVTHQYKSTNGKRIVQLGPDGISINVLGEEYTDSFGFEELVGRILESYWPLAAVDEVTRLGLRYINGLPSGTRFLESLTARVDWPELGGGTPQSTAARGLFAYQHPKGILGVAIQSPDAKLGTKLDLDFFSQPARAMSLEGIHAWFNDAHERIHDAFRAMVSPEQYQAWK